MIRFNKTKALISTIILLAIGVFIIIWPIIADASADRYINATWNKIAFFNYGTISFPSEWTYSVDDGLIQCYNADGEIVLNIYEDYNALHPNLTDMQEAEIYALDIRMGTGILKPSAESYVCTYQNNTYYISGYYKEKMFSNERTYFGRLIADGRFVTENEFENIVCSLEV